MLGEHKEILKSIILTQYRSQRAFAGVLTGRKSQRPDLLPSNKGNSRVITVDEIAEDYSGNDFNKKVEKPEGEVSIQKIID